jgi:hypothetical protein
MPIGLRNKEVLAVVPCDLRELRSALSVERVWEAVFPSRATQQAWSFGRASRGTSQLPIRFH